MPADKIVGEAWRVIKNASRPVILAGNGTIRRRASKQLRKFTDSTGIGVISLAGVVVNNAIILIDYVIQLRDRGIDKRESLIQAGLTRFRPVLLTAVTTILGLLPMAIGVSFDFRDWAWDIGSESSQWWGPMAIAVIFGLGVATILTLVVVPSMIAFQDRIGAFVHKVAAFLRRGRQRAFEKA